MYRKSDSFKKKNSSLNYKCVSTITKGQGYIHKIIEGRNSEGDKFVRVQKREERIPQIGDKFSSRCAQKGTVGMILPDEDMPFNKDGLKPDFIINPHCIPSRMTIGQLLESVLSKIALLYGGIVDCTAFNGLDIDNLDEILEDDNYGYDILYDGVTGKQFKSKIFQAPTFYQKLIHMVADKMHSRCSGPIVQLTRQPPEGRSRDGGLRIGEMERDCMISHGTTLFLKESLLERSDLFPAYVCKKCGKICIYNEKEKLYKCNKCIDSYNFKKIHIPYAFKLLSHELNSMLIDTQFLLD